MSNETATASTVEFTATTPVLMLALELSEEKWKLGFSSAFGQTPLVRDIGSRDTKALLAQMVWAKKKLGQSGQARVVSCYEAGREGFWLHRFLVAHGVENLIVDSSSIEVPQKRRRAKTDRLDLAGLCDLLARHVAGSAKPVWSVVRVPTEADEDRRHLHRELNTSKQDRTRVSNRIKSLLANNGLTLSSWKDLPGQLKRLRLWNGNRLPSSLRGRLERYASDYAYCTDRIRDLESERRRLLSEEMRSAGSQGPGGLEGGAALFAAGGRRQHRVAVQHGVFRLADVSQHQGGGFIWAGRVGLTYLRCPSRSRFFRCSRAPTGGFAELKRSCFSRRSGVLSVRFAGLVARRAPMSASWRSDKPIRTDGPSPDRSGAP